MAVSPTLKGLPALGSTVNSVLIVSASGLLDEVTGASGSDGDVLTIQADGTWAAETPAGGGSPGGVDTNIQFNNAGAFGGSSTLVWSGGKAGIGTGSPAEIIHASVAGSWWAFR